MAAFFGVLAIIQGVVIILLSHTQIKRTTNIIVGFVFIGIGIALMN